MDSSSIYHERRPWGEFIRYTRNVPSTVKLIKIRVNESLSLQYHNTREEYWYVISGNGRVRIGDETHDAKPDDDFFVPRKAKHSIQAMDTDMTVLEISTGDFDEDDIVRLEDKYGRATTQ